MNKKTDIELERDDIIVVNRTLIRLKHSLAARREINAILPDTLLEFDKAVQRGELKSIAGLLEEILES